MYTGDTSLYQVSIQNVNFDNGDNEQKLKINGIFLSPRGITLPKIIDQTQIQTQPVYTSYTSLYRISIQNVNL